MISCIDECSVLLVEVDMLKQTSAFQDGLHPNSDLSDEALHNPGCGALGWMEERALFLLVPSMAPIEIGARGYMG